MNAGAPLENAPTAAADRIVEIEGTVQGIGFRPFAARLATEIGVRGWVRNHSRGVTLRIAGDPCALDRFIVRLRTELPSAGHISALRQSAAAGQSGLPPAPTEAFAIIASAANDTPTAAVTPDLALCPECRAELLAADDRRYGYPFINCTRCGPRYSILQELPYDRPHTTMREFVMCSECAREYADPANRRFHAQPNACPRCGPRVELQQATGAVLGSCEAAIEAAAAALLRGQIVAVKGLGGFHLLVDATNEHAVAELRQRKHRDEKPFAVMAASLADVRAFAETSAADEALLASAAAPIVLVRRRPNARLAHGIAPGNPWIGALLAYTPLHVLLLAAVGRPVVATSGNLAEEPLCIHNDEARERLGTIADLFLVHDRPIARAIDDSVLRPAREGAVLLRRARGFAPAPLRLPEDARAGAPLLCVGGHQKNTLAVTAGSDLVLSPHLGDLDGPLALAAFRRTIELFRSFHQLTFGAVVCDAHPDYASTRFAATLGLPVVPVQHHLAHVLACLLEHDGGPERVLGVAWDGTGYGPDGTIWGGEFIAVDRRARTARRVAHLQPFRLPGGVAAVREPRRTALGLLHELFPDAPDRVTEIGRLLGFTEAELEVLQALLARQRHAPVTSSAGRLFDGVAALLGLRQRATFEGQPAMEVEFAADQDEGDAAPWPMPVLPGNADGPLCLDWRPALAMLLRERTALSPATLAARFHATLAAGIAEVAVRAGFDTVALSGGCFQNVRLLELTMATLRARGFAVLRHHRLPPNDGGLAAGQALAARWGITVVG